MENKINLEEIKKLQNHYFKFCEDNLLKDKTIHNFCKEAEVEINNNYNELYEKTSRKNLISTPFERLVTFHVISYFLKNSINIKLVPSIISSDLIFELDDCFINIDCKTVNIWKNPSDAKDISVSPNQMTFKCPPLYKKVFPDGTTFSGFHYEGHQSPLPNNKPNFTFMFKLVYADNYSDKDIEVKGEIKSACEILDITNLTKLKARKFKNLSLTVACVPNGLTVNEKIKSNILQGFKTYDYVTSKKNFSNKYKPVNRLKTSWKKIPLKEIEKGKKLVFFLDKNLSHPHYPKELAVRALQEKKYCIILGGGAARLNRDFIDIKKFIF